MLNFVVEMLCRKGNNDGNHCAGCMGAVFDFANPAGGAIKV